MADIYGLDGQLKIGSFTVDFSSDFVDEKNTNGYTEIIEREEGSAVVSQLEIISTPGNYRQILDYILTNGGKLIIINRKG